MAPPTWAWKGTSTASTSTAVIPYPASGVLASDIPILVVISKASSGTGEPPAVADPTGFTKLFEAWGGNGTAGTDTGPVKLSVWQKTTDADGSENGTSVSVVNPAGSAMVYGNLHGVRRATAGSTIVTASASGQDAVSDVSWSVTCGSDPGITTDDLLLWLAGGTVNPTSTFTVEATTATGCTFGTMTEQEDSASATGFGSRRVVATMACTAGPSSAAPVLTATSASAAQSGVGAVLRIREVGGPTNVGTPPTRFAPGQGPRLFQRFPVQPQGFVLPAGGQTFLQTLDGSLTPVGALAKQTSKTLAGATTPAGVLTKQVAKPLAGIATPTGALANQDQKPLGGGITQAGALTTTKVVLRAFAGTISPAGTLAKLIGKPFAGATTPAGVVAKQEQKPFAGTITPAGSLAKQAHKAFAGSLTPTGTLATTRVILRSFAGAISPAGTLTRQAGKALGGATTPAAILTRQIAKMLAGLLAPAGTPAKRPAKPLAGSTTLSGSLVTSIPNPIAPGHGVARAGSTTGTAIAAATAGTARAGPATGTATAGATAGTVQILDQGGEVTIG